LEAASTALGAASMKLWAECFVVDGVVHEAEGGVDEARDGVDETQAGVPHVSWLNSSRLMDEPTSLVKRA
jgi:hypothetical protein